MNTRDIVWKSLRKRLVEFKNLPEEIHDLAQVWNNGHVETLDEERYGAEVSERPLHEVLMKAINCLDNGRPIPMDMIRRLPK